MSTSLLMAPLRLGSMSRCSPLQHARTSAYTTDGLPDTYWGAAILPDSVVFALLYACVAYFPSFSIV